MVLDRKNTYCSNWKCNREDCAKHHYNQPWDTPTIQIRYTPSDDGTCDGFKPKEVDR